MIVFDGELVKAETQETRDILGMSREDVLILVRRMRDGDVLVVNAREEDRGDWR